MRAAIVAVVMSLVVYGMSYGFGFSSFGFNFGSVKRTVVYEWLQQVLSWSDDAFDFGSHDVGTTSETSFVISNTGNDVAEDVAITTTGSAFSLYSTVTFGNISSGKTRTAKVRFTPLAGQVYTGYVNYSAPNIARTSISLSGTGVGASTPDPDYYWVCNDNAASTVVSATYGTAGVASANTSTIQTGTGFAFGSDAGKFYGSPSASLYTDGAFTIQMDFKKVSTSSYSKLILNNSANLNMSVYVSGDNQIRVYHSYPTPGANTYITTTGITDGSYHTLRFAYDGTNLKTYFGADEGSLSLIDTTAATFAAWGSATNFYSSAWGEIRNVKIWNGSVTP